MRPPSCMRSVVDRNVVMRRKPALAPNVRGWTGEIHEIPSLAEA